MKCEIPEYFAQGRFEVQRVLGKGGMGVVYEVLDRDRNMRVALKTLRRFDFKTIQYFKGEFRSLHDLVHPNLCSLMELIEDEGIWLLTMELVDGRSFLSHVSASGPLTGGPASRAGLAVPGHLTPVKNATSDADVTTTNQTEPTRPRLFDEARLRSSLAGLFQGLFALHNAGKVHRDIKPSNVLVSDEGRVVLLDFGLTTDVTMTRRSEQKHIVGTVEYMSPEQASSKKVGPAADWYSVGVMLYEALTSKLPFSGPPIRVLLAKQKTDPPRPSELVPDLPHDLDVLCSALLRRDPESRPTVEEIADILQLDDRARVPTRHINFHTIGSEIIFVGREAELKTLHAAYRRMLAGSFESVVIEGVSGVGKSALAHQFISALSRDKPPLVLRGRCYERETAPFKAFDGIIDDIVRCLRKHSCQSFPELQDFDSQFLLRLFPSLNRIAIFSRRSPPENIAQNPKEFQNWAFDAFKQLLFILSSKLSIIVMIDDVQWIDEDSIQLLQHLTNGIDVPKLMLLVTARYSSEKMASVLDWNSVLSPTHERIHLRLLDENESLEMVRLVLEKENLATHIEAEQIASESAGHPLYIAELIQHIATGAEDWRSLRLDDVIWNRVRTLPGSTRRLLETICVLGTPFKKDNLQNLTFLTSEDFYNGMRELIASNLIRSEGPSQTHRVETYHDKVREAVLERLGPARLTKAHLNIGLFLLTVQTDDEYQDNVFDVVRHLEAGKDLITASSEKRLLAELYFRAGMRAHKSAAFASSLSFLKKSMALFPKEGWNSHYRTMLNLHSVAAEAAYIEGDFSLTKELVRIAVREAKSDLDRIPIWKTYVLSLVAEGNPLAGIDETVNILKRFGFRLPHRPSRFYVFCQTIALRMQLIGKTSEQLINLTHSTDPYTTAVRGLLGTISGVANLYLPDLWAVMTIKLIQLSLNFGVDHLSAIPFSSWGMFNCGFLKNYKEGYKYGTVALRIMDRFQDKTQDAMTIHLYAVFIQHWREHLRQTLPLLQESHKLARSSGDTFNLVYTGTHFCYYCFHAGKNLSELADECSLYANLIEQKKQKIASVKHLVLHQTILNLIGRTDNHHTIPNTPYSEIPNCDLPDDHSEDVSLVDYFQCVIILNIYFGNYFEAHVVAQKAKKQRATGTYFDSVLPFYDSLACLKLIGKVDARLEKSLIRLALDNQKQYKITMKNCPANHTHKYQLIEALYASFRGKHQTAEELFEQAIERANENQFVNDASLALELATEHYQRTARKDKFQIYAQRTICSYEKWGAGSKAQQVARRFNLQTASDSLGSSPTRQDDVGT